MTTEVVLTSVVSLAVTLAAATWLTVSVWRDWKRNRHGSVSLTTLTTLDPYPPRSVILVDNIPYRVVSCTQQQGQGPYTLIIVRKGTKR